jgi:hypothetical protein
MATFDDREFRIDPRPTPILSIALQNLLIVSVCCVLQWAFNEFEVAGDQVPYYAIPVFGVFVCVFFTLFAVYSFRSANLGGTWFIYDKQADRVKLPREGESFDRGEVVHFQYITTRTGVEESRSELNVITLRDGKRERWPLLRSSSQLCPFDSVLHLLVAHTGLPVLRVTDGYRPMEVTQELWSGN